MPLDLDLELQPVSRGDVKGGLVYDNLEIGSTSPGTAANRNALIVMSLLFGVMARPVVGRIPRSSVEHAAVGAVRRGVGQKTTEQSHGKMLDRQQPDDEKTCGESDRT
jgi:hypothetical protein